MLLSPSFCFDPTISLPRSRPKVDATHLVQEFLRTLNVTRDAQESEYKRRVAWEQELEAKYQQRQAETETQLAEMKREIAYLKTCVDSLLHERPHDTAQTSGSVYPHEESGSSLAVPRVAISEGPSRQGTTVERMSVDASSPSSPVSQNDKGATPSPNDGESDSGDSESEAVRHPKRTNNHDKKCYTIQVLKVTYIMMTVK